MLVRHWMTEQVELAHPEDDLTNVAARLRGRSVRQLPVVSQGRLVGIVTDRDVRSAPDSSATVEMVMNRKPVTTTSGTRVEDAAEMLRGLKVNALPVVDGDALVGIITESDLLEALIELCHLFEPTTLLEVECEEGGVAVQRLRDLLERHHASVRWLSAAPGENGRQLVALRVDAPIGHVPERELEEAGYRVLSVVMGDKSARVRERSRRAGTPSAAGARHPRHHG